MRGAKIIKKGARKQVPTPQLHGSEIVRIYCTAQSIAITFQGLGWAGSFSSSERQCFEEGKTWETENDEYYPSANCVVSLLPSHKFSIIIPKATDQNTKKQL